MSKNKTSKYRVPVHVSDIEKERNKIARFNFLDYNTEEERGGLNSKESEAKTSQLCEFDEVEKENKSLISIFSGNNKKNSKRNPIKNNDFTKSPWFKIIGKICLPALAIIITIIIAVIPTCERLAKLEVKLDINEKNGSIILQTVESNKIEFLQVKNRMNQINSNIVTLETRIKKLEIK